MLVFDIVGMSLSEPHSNIENGTVVNAQRTVVKNGIATYSRTYCI